MEKIRTTIECSFALIILFLFTGCDKDDDQLSPVAAFELSDDLIAVNEPISVLDQSIEAENLAWFINDSPRIDLNDNQQPTFFFDTPGTHEIKLIATSSDNLKDSITRIINVDYFTTTSISFTKYFEDFKNWDPDSVGVKQNPDVIFRRQVGPDILFEGVTHWNTTPEDLPIDITIPNDWTFGFNEAPITEFLFYDDDLDTVEPMYRNGFGQNWEYDNVTNTGQVFVTTGGVEYVVGFRIL